MKTFIIKPQERGVTGFVQNADGTQYKEPNLNYRVTEAMKDVRLLLQPLAQDFEMTIDITFKTKER